MNQSPVEQPSPGSPPQSSPTLRVLTSFSVYEVDLESNRVRRMTGLNPPTERQGADGEWQQCIDILFDDDTILFVWGMNDDGSARCTRTSHIVHVEEVDRERSQSAGT